MKTPRALRLLAVPFFLAFLPAATCAQVKQDAKTVITWTQAKCLAENPALDPPALALLCLADETLAPVVIDWLSAYRKSVAAAVGSAAASASAHEPARLGPPAAMPPAAPSAPPAPAAASCPPAASSAAPPTASAPAKPKKSPSK